MISSSFSLSINIKSRVPVLLLVILNSASKSYKISWLYQNLSSRVLNEFRDFASSYVAEIITTLSKRFYRMSFYIASVKNKSDLIFLNCVFY